MMKNSISAFKTTLIPLLVFFCVTPAWAAITVVGELSQKETTTIGSSYSGTIDIANPGERNERVQLTQNDYLFTSDGNNTFHPPGTDPRSNAQWVTILQDDIVIAPGKVVKVPFSVNVPVNAALAGTYWSLIFVEAITDSLLNPDRPDDGTVGVQMNLRYGIQIISHIGETGEKLITIDNIQKRDNNGVKAIAFDITNTGESSVSTAIYAQVYSDKGKYIGRFEGKRKGTFPGCSVNIFIEFPDLENGKYRMQIIADGGGNSVFGVLVAPEFT
jgi:hypothetical protein